MKDIISKKTRLEFRELLVNWTLREISQEFDAADVPCDLEYVSPETGQRRSLVDQYYHAIDFKSWKDVRKLLKVYENVLLHLEEKMKVPVWGQKDEWAEKNLSLLIRYLERDGFTYQNNRLSSIGGQPALEQITTTAHTLDAHTLREQIDRIRNSIDDDPSLAIGTAKELLETTCKTILADSNIQIEESWDLPRLVKEARAVLKLIPEEIPDSSKGAESIKRVLGSLSQVAQGVAELRNMYGTGHGKDGRFKGLSPRHARLAVGCSTVLATFLFETYEARHNK